MSLRHRDPFEEGPLLRRAVDRLLDEFSVARHSRGDQMRMSWEPAVDVFETVNEVVVRAELPSVDPTCLNIDVTSDTIMIRGVSRAEGEEKARTYHHREVRCGAFMRALELPAEVNGDEAKAVYKDGVLEVMIPKTGRAKLRTDKV